MLSQTNINELQPHFVVNLGDKVHVICVSDIRRLANGECYRGDEQEMIRLLATVIKDLKLNG